MAGRTARVAITGGIAEGKSTVLRYLREAGYRVASADEAARSVLSDPSVRREVASAAHLAVDFSPVDLRNVLSGEPERRRAVNGVLHPRIIECLDLAEAQFTEVPLLIEDALQDRYDRVWVVTCGSDEQRRRLVERVGDPDLALRLLPLQLPTSAKLAFADEVVRTNRPEEAVKAYALQAALSLNKLGVAKRVK